MNAPHPRPCESAPQVTETDRKRFQTRQLGPFLLIAFVAVGARAAPPSLTLDLATLSPAADPMVRVHGYTGSGLSGLPVAGPYDIDGDGFKDSAFASFLADPLGRVNAGELYVIFGNGSFGDTLDTANASDTRILRIIGEATSENAGSELWIDDVTGDGVGDLLIARQNYSPDPLLHPPARSGAGALTIIRGGPELRALAGVTTLDLAAPPPSVSWTTLVGAAAGDRLGIWMRTGDITGDGLADVVVAADQADAMGANSGEAYLLRGGPHWSGRGIVDLQSFGSTALAGDIARVRPPAGSNAFHFGGSCDIAHLDGDANGEILVAATLNRASAALPPAGATEPFQASGGKFRGALYIVWGEAFSGPLWPEGLSLSVDDPGIIRTRIQGGLGNTHFGEEILGGRDYDGDAQPDLFVGDIIGNLQHLSGENRPFSGSGHVFYDAASLRGLDFDLDNPPSGLVTTTILGAAALDIAADTAMDGDFDGDGRDDLAIGSPQADPLGRTLAGTIDIFHGRSGPWPSVVDLKEANLPASSALRLTRILGALGNASNTDLGDMICYSATAGDLDGNGTVDLIFNEMAGNGIASGTDDVGTLLILSGTLTASSPVPVLPAVLHSVLVAALLLTGGGLLHRLRR